MTYKSLDPDKWDSARERFEKMQRSAPVMPRAEYLRKYPKGGPYQYSGPVNEKYIEFLSAVKRRKKEENRPAVRRFLWAALFLLVVFIGLWIIYSFPIALVSVLFLVILYCFIQMGMNLPNKF